MLRRVVTDLVETAQALVALPVETRRVVRRVDALLDDVEPPLRALAAAVDAAHVGRAVDGLVEMQRQVAAIAQTTGRIMSIIDDVGSRMASLPMAPLLSGRRRVAKPELKPE
jgi:hypothetical protein